MRVTTEMKPWTCTQLSSRAPFYSAHKTGSQGFRYQLYNSAPLLKSKVFKYHRALVNFQQSSALTHQCGRIISRRKAKTAIRILKIGGKTPSLFSVTWTSLARHVIRRSVKRFDSPHYNRISNHQMATIYFIELNASCLGGKRQKNNIANSKCGSHLRIM